MKWEYWWRYRRASNFTLFLFCLAWRWVDFNYSCLKYITVDTAVLILDGPMVDKICLEKNALTWASFMEWYSILLFWCRNISIGLHFYFITAKLASCLKYIYFKASSKPKCFLTVAFKGHYPVLVINPLVETVGNYIMLTFVLAVRFWNKIPGVNWSFLYVEVDLITVSNKVLALLAKHLKH